MKLPIKTDSRRILTLGLSAIFLFMGMLSAGLAFAQSSGDEIVVNTTADSKKKSDGECSLREAIISANDDRTSGNRSNECGAGSGSDVILLPEGVYTLTRSDNGSENSSNTGDLDIRGDLTIRPENPGDIVVISAGAIPDRVFHVLSGNVTIERLTIRDGGNRDNGGGVLHESGNLTISNSTLTGNQADAAGGALYTMASTTLDHVTVKDNTAPDGSGLAVGCDGDGCGELTVGRSLIANNSCDGPIVDQGDNVYFGAGSACPGTEGNPLLTAESFAGKVAYFTPGHRAAAFDIIDGPCEADQLDTERPQYALCDVGAIELINVNDPPVAVADSASVDEDSSVPISMLDNDLIGGDDVNQTLSLDSVGAPDFGSLSVQADDSVIYSPDADYFGQDNFSYIVCDSGGMCAEGTVTVTVNSVNDVVTAADDSLNTSEDTPIEINVQGNDSAGPDNEDQTLFTTTASDPDNGSTAIDAEQILVTYTPDADYFGSDTFTYTVCDSAGSCAEATVTVTIDAVNDAPAAVDDEPSTNEDILVPIHVAANDTDVESNLDPSTVVTTTNPAGGSLFITPVGVIEYTPDPHFNGSDSFDYQICDTNNACSPASVEVSVTADAYIEVTNVCGDDRVGSLRWAIGEANSQENDPSSPDTIVFDIIDYTDTCGTDTINLTEALPPLTDPVIIDGLAVDADASKPFGSFTPGDTVPYITLDGGGLDFSGITIQTNAGGSTIANLIINNFGGSGILIGDDGAPSDNNTIASNTISNNGSLNPPVTSLSGVDLNDGITIFGVNNTLNGNNIFGNGDLNVDLEGDGATPNDPGDGDEGANDVQNYPWLLSATPAGEITGYLNSAASSDYTLQFFVSQTCNGDLSIPLNVAPAQFTTGSDGNVQFSTTIGQNDSITYGQFIIATATDGEGNTSEYSNCIPVDDDNTVWPTAKVITPDDPPLSQPLIQLGQSRWYRFQVSPNSRVKITLDNLPANYDLVYYSDVGQAYIDLINELDPDLNELGAESSTDAFAPAVFNPAVFNPAVFNPAVFNPAVFNPAVFNPAVFNPAVFNPAIFSADVYSPAVFNPAVFNPAVFSPAVFSPAVFSPAVFNPAVFNGNAYSAAQMTSLITASGEDGTAPEEININSYNSDGWFYVRVRGRQGAFDPNVSFTLDLDIVGGVCEGITEDFNLSDPAFANSGYKTVILTDWSRMGLGDPNVAGTDAANLLGDLNDLAFEVDGVVVDVSQDAEVMRRRVQAVEIEGDAFDSYPNCPYAMNILADGIKDIVDAYRLTNPIEYVVIIGNDDVIPFYRIPDQALIGPEEDYIVPVLDNTTSEASLRNNYFLSQDGYGAKLGLSVKNDILPLPEVAVGRLVETDEQISNMIQVFLNDQVLEPQNALVTAYDFLTDGGEDVRNELAASIADVNDDLLVANPTVWSANDLANTLDSYDFDIAFLSGHFSATGALAADYATGYYTSDFLASTTNLEGALLFSAGCHSGYNIVDAHAIEGYTPDNVTDPDWAAAMAIKGVTFIGGTGYQYGDTDFAEYSERLYHEFTRQLRSDATPTIAVGKALTAAKQQYMKDTPKLTGIHQKAVLEATLFGLPMTAVDMQTGKITLEDGAPTLTVDDLDPVDNPSTNQDPGQIFGLKSYNFIKDYSLTLGDPKSFSSVDNPGDSVAVTYLQNGPGGFVSGAAEPTLPLDTFNAAVTGDLNGGPGANDLVLRGVGFMGGDYTDTSGKYPLVGAPTTELSAVHFSFLSFVFYPQQPWSVNRFDSLTDSSGSTLLNLFPAQYRTEQAFVQSPPATQRQFDSMNMRLYYLSDSFMNGLSVGTNRPDLASAPTIVTVNGQALGNPAQEVQFEVMVVGDPSAGIQDVWITYTDISNPAGGSWQSLPLSQDENDSRIWRGELPGVSSPQNLRFIAQAVSGTGLVTMSNNLGRFYIPDVSGASTTLIEVNPPVDRIGAVGTTVQLSAQLSSNGAALPNMPVLFGIGQDIRLGWTGTGDDGTVLGQATVDVPLLGTPPGEYEVTISFPGTVAYAQSSAVTEPFTVIAQDTSLSLSPELVNIETTGADVPLFATLTDSQGRPLAEKTVTFTVTDGDLYSARKAVITDPLGQARLGRMDFPQEVEYTVSAKFEATGSYNESFSDTSSTIRFNRPPDCSEVVVSTLNGKPTLWPANNKLVGITLSGATDLDGDALTYSFLEIWQDEPVGDDLDGTITNSCSDAEVRSQRDGNGDGRTYHVYFEVDDGNGGTCSGVATIETIPHDKGGTGNPGDPLYNSLGAGVPACTP